MAESSTPKKIFRFIKFTPTTKKTLCVICGNRIEKSDYRRKLFHGSIKSEYCILIEKYLEINITEETHADTACRKCVRELQKIDSVFTTFKSSYQNTLAKLRETHGHNSVSFKRQFSEDGSATVNSRKSLFPRDEEKEEDSEFNIDTKTDSELKVIWKLLYSTSSARDQGTLYAARNTINARNVTQDPADDFYAASDLVEKVTTAYIITGGLTHFGMESIDSLPCKNVYEGAVGNTNEMKEYIFDQARSFVKTFTLPEIPKLPEYGPNCNTYNCRYCGKKYKQPHSLRKHESSIHGHYDPLFAKEKVSSGKYNENESDGVSAYTKLVLTLGLLRMDHNDAIHMGDGSRMLKIDQFLVLYYKYCHCTKYAFGTLETIAQTEVLLTERQAHRLIWNRTVNHKGDANTNHPNDLDVEHCNKVFKDSAHSYRGVFTEKVVSRVSKSAMKVHEIIKQFDKMCNVHVPSGRHKTCDKEIDIITLVRQFQACNLFDFIPGRSHYAYPNMKENPLTELDMEIVRDWIGASLKKFQNKHFY
ncbi:Hypothetical predicted protein [Mytilus galloprovincialis]|uniref:C2H2-type domain-containing protein n=1 Tax=Mytilus galloprovincialis TaxID=29158 RepID=A0A8B6DUD4_MYTGA|nr:Hypothetical predicted protein [Mytilus galloprovincialis]